MKFGQLKECNMRKIFLNNHTQNVVEKLVQDHFLKNLNWGYLWINSLKFYTVYFSCISSWGLSKYLETKVYVTCKFSTRVEIHPGVEIHPRMNSTLPMVKALFVVTCWNELKFQPYSYFNPVLTTGLKFQLGYNSACFYHVT